MDGHDELIKSVKLEQTDEEEEEEEQHQKANKKRCSSAGVKKKSGAKAAAASTDESAFTGFRQQADANQSRIPSSKRPPPSASHITEAGLPFPIIDTSAPHSSLFVHPDTSGLSKREARLVKNRAAAFLSRQRKREQYEELDGKCRSLCRLTWHLWEECHRDSTKSGAAGDKQANSTAARYASTAESLTKRLGAEDPDVVFSLQQVLERQGAPIAPTEEGPSSLFSAFFTPSEHAPSVPQMLGAIFSNQAATHGDGSSSAASVSQSAKATEKSGGKGKDEAGTLRLKGEVARLQAELNLIRAREEESRKREEELKQLLLDAETRAANFAAVSMPYHPAFFGMPPPYWQQYPPFQPLPNVAPTTSGSIPPTSLVSPPEHVDDASGGSTSTPMPHTPPPNTPQAHAAFRGNSNLNLTLAPSGTALLRSAKKGFESMDLDGGCRTPIIERLAMSRSVSAASNAFDRDGDLKMGGSSSVPATSSMLNAKMEAQSPRKAASGMALMVILIGFALLGFPGAAEMGKLGIAKQGGEAR